MSYSISHHLCNCSLTSTIYWLPVGTHVSGTDPRFDPEEQLASAAADFGRVLAKMKCPSNYLSGLIKATMGDAVVCRRGIYMSGTDPRFDPFCVWGNEIFMNKRQVRKLRKIVRRKKRVIGIKLFIYTLSKTTVNFRMWFPKLFTEWRQLRLKYIIHAAMIML